ncbi:zeta toxin family protein [Arthrobacter sp. A2-55]|uniref:zeta toxin family protein n=1 Tax=Arthrobacter sp. A2-55 TaxID=2897337 RepID=UPI0021CD8BB1|nr:zeta toxin family protein [Arthrobacter sp. A2-55]MCU6479037.1 zeta toxin family protein [Arthrobacter sp. A2-55]
MLSVDESEETHRALTELLAPGGDLHTPPEMLGRYFDDEAIVRTARIYMSAQQDVVQAGRAVVVSAGRPAAGKSTVLSSLNLVGYRLIDPDIAKDLLLRDAEAHGMLDYRLGPTLPDGGPIKIRELAAHVHSASNRVGDLVRHISMAAGENIIIDGTLRWEPLCTQYITELFDRGYAGLDVVDVELPLERALQRARDRWWDGRQQYVEGGRFLPEDAIRACYDGDPREGLSARNAVKLAEDAADGLGHGSLRRFDLDPVAQAPIQTKFTIYGQ